MGSTIHEVAPELPLGTVSTLRSAMLRRGGWEQIRENRIIAALLATLAIILGMAGVYGIIDDLVARRSREMGIRLALGAKPRALIAMIVRQAFSLATLSAVAGTALSVALRSRIQLWVFGDQVLRQHESGFITALALVAIAAAAIFACVLASWLPAARISRLRPTDVLSSE
jgi:ABC-type antimicrobial peptide transport system permease subunit